MRITMDIPHPYMYTPRKLRRLSKWWASLQSATTSRELNSASASSPARSSRLTWQGKHCKLNGLNFFFCCKNLSLAGMTSALLSASLTDRWKGGFCCCTPFSWKTENVKKFKRLKYDWQVKRQIMHAFQVLKMAFQVFLQQKQNIFCQLSFCFDNLAPK